MAELEDYLDDELEGDREDELDSDLIEGPHPRAYGAYRTFRRILEDSSGYEEQQSSKLSWRDLYDVGALEIVDPQPSDLENDVHPIFRPKNFDSTPKQYNLILPCLQLATRILDDPHALHWFDALLNCPRRHLPAASLMSHDLNNFPDPTFAGQNDFEAHIGDRYSFHLRNPFEAHHFMAVQEILRTFEDAITFNFHDREPQADARRDHPFRQGFKTIVSLDLNTLACLASPQTHSICQYLRVQLLYTVTIVHEIAHAVAISTRQNDWEDYFEYDRLSECGYSLEQAIFGGRITTATEPDDCAGALYFHDWPDFDDNICPFSPPLWKVQAESWYMQYVVPMHYVQMLFTTAFWEEKNMARAGAITLRLPRTVGERVWNDEKVDEGLERLLEAENNVHTAYRAAQFGVMVRE
ncbi:MAG: hypothetical protein M1836_005191 [Candelina mexicana]|nr:MAG: hypothetical protein M1836_005191 [Candelina mexicana]